MDATLIEVQDGWHIEGDSRQWVLWRDGGLDKEGRVRKVDATYHPTLAAASAALIERHARTCGAKTFARLASEVREVRARIGELLPAA